MSDISHEIPDDRLPEGFGDALEQKPAQIAPTRPAATIVLMRDLAARLEVLLLRRNRKTGFVPGAYVFPGGRVDASDATLDPWWRGLDADRAAKRLGLSGEASPGPLAYYTAALREAFEETGLLVGTRIRRSAQASVDGLPDPAVLAAAREALMTGEGDFLGLLDEGSLRLDGTAVEYIAHWVTPEIEPRRYDTRFFAAKVDPEARVSIDEREMTSAVWLTPGTALDRYEAGELPMVFPTIRTLEDLAAFGSVDSVLEHYADRDIPMILPELVKTPTGVGLRIP